MNQPVALKYAKDLLAHAQRLGPAYLMELIVTNEEGFELLDWFQSQPAYAACELLKADIERAKAKGDPFPVLENFTLMGLHMRAPLVH